MKKVFLLLLFLLFPINVFATNEVNVYFFHADGCHNCDTMDTCLNEIKNEYPINIIKYQVRGNEENTNIMNKVKTTLSNKNLSGVPFIALGNKYVYGGSEYKCNDLRDLVEEYTNGDYVDVISSIINDTYVKEEEEEVVVLESDNDKDDVKEVFSNPTLVISIILIIGLFIFYVTTIGKGDNEDEKKEQ